MVEDFDWTGARIVEDVRFAYPEKRFQALGLLGGALHMSCMRSSVVTFASSHCAGPAERSGGNMAKRPNPSRIDEENPEWTDEDFARARPASEMLPPAVYDGLFKKKPGQRGPGKKAPKVSITIRVAAAALARIKADGPGWQTRISKMIEAAAQARKKTPKRKDEAA
jgi:uncharacterized protein (DUF4415 family)